MDDWPFADPPDVATITTRQIIHGNEPILLVSRDADDGCWQFLTGGAFEVADGMIILLRNMIARDPSLAELAALPRAGKLGVGDRVRPGSAGQPRLPKIKSPQQL